MPACRHFILFHVITYFPLAMVELFIVHCSMLSSILIMGGCTAPNCSSFPREKIRKDKWVQNCRRDKWIPTAHSELCEVIMYII